jgi:hypothetical protein
MNSGRIPRSILKKNKLGKISMTMEGFYLVISATGVNMSNSGRDDDYGRNFSISHYFPPEGLSPRRGGRA